jgi:hypothetical protein
MLMRGMMEVTNGALFKACSDRGTRSSLILLDRGPEKVLALQWYIQTSTKSSALDLGFLGSLHNDQSGAES